MDRGSTASSLIVGLYSNAGGQPGTLLSTGSIDFPVPGAWNPVRLEGVTLRGGTVYWLAILGEGGVLRYREAQSGQCSSETSSQSPLSALPPSWGSEKTESNCPVSAYVTLPTKAPPGEFIVQPALVPLPASPPAASPVGAAPTLTSPLAPPESVALPTISGTPMKGEVLSASEGEWTESPTSYGYQWQECEASGEGCADVEGANEGSYTLGSADVGHTLRVLVTAANASGGASASSLPTGVVEESPPPKEPLPPPPSSTVLPKISGEALEGEVLSASEGEWTGDPTSYAYQWQRCAAAGSGCSDVGGATGSTYGLSAGDVGDTMRVVVTATNAGGAESVSSEPTEIVEALPPPPPLAPMNIILPAISGTAIQGKVLSASEGEWSGSPTSYAYRWQRCAAAGGGCSNVSGATHSTYSLGSGDVGYTLRVVVSATNAGGTGSADSLATSVVSQPPPPAPSNTALPAISGTAIQGKVLSASEGEWSGNPTSYTYQWQRCGTTGGGCSNVSGATHSTYSLGSGDVGYTLRVVVSATNAGGTTSATSDASSVVTAPAPAPPTNSSVPVITGSTVEGQSLSASKGMWTGSPTSYAYQWQDCNSSGTGCANVSGATASTYTLAASDVGHTMSVVVSASNAGGSTAATSAHTAVITAAASDPDEPSLTATHCWNEVETEGAARLEACGYPGPNNTGVEKGVTLTESSEDGGPCHVVLTGTEHYEDKRVKGTECGITIAASATGVVIKNDEVNEENACKEALCYVNPIQFDNYGEEGAKGTRIEHVFVHAPEKGPAPRVTHNVAQTCINGEFNDPYVAEYVRAEHCSGFKLNSGGTLNHVYCPSNYEIAGEHMECVTDDSEELNAAKEKTPLIIENSTIFQKPPENQEECENGAHEIKLTEEPGCPGAGMTAAFFPQGEVAPIQEIRLEKDFFDGGAFTIYGGNEDDGIAGPFIVRKDRFARCLAATCPKSSTEEAQGGGLQKIRGNVGDGYGYYERGGVYGVAVNLNKGVTTWAENFWDNNREVVAE